MCPSGLYHLGDFEMDFGSGDLRRAGQVVRLKPQPCRVLRMLVDRPGETVLRDEIQRQVWGDDTFVDFERGLNSCIKQIRAAFGDDPGSPRYVETIPRRGYRFIAPVSIADGERSAAKPLIDGSGSEPVPEGVPPASAFAPAREERASASQKPAVLRPRRLIQGSAIAVLLAVTVLAVLSLSLRRGHNAPAPARIRMAVLPFENLSGDPAQDFLGDGLAEEMITRLGAIAPQRLGVIARTSAAQYRRSSKPAAQIGSELQVGYLLEGSVRRDGAKLHVTAQLIQTADQTQLWAAAYDRDAADTLAIERDLAERVARSLALRLLPPRDSVALAPQTRVPEAHDAYLRGRYEMNRMTLDGFRRARAHFERALRSDPNFSLAYAALADTWSLEPWWGGASPKDAFPKARAAAEQALRLDDSLAEAHTSMGFIRLYYDWDFTGAEQEFERALQLQPGLALAHYWYAGMLSAAGRHADAIASIQRAQELDPLSPLINADAGWYYFYARRYDEALRECRRALETDPGFAFARQCMMEAHHAQGNDDAAAGDAREIIRMLAARQGRDVPALAGNGAEALRSFAARKLAAMQRMAGNQYISPYELAVVHLALDQKDDAFAELRRAREQRDTLLVLLNVDPRFDAVRSDPRFAGLQGPASP